MGVVGRWQASVVLADYSNVPWHWIQFLCSWCAAGSGVSSWCASGAACLDSQVKMCHCHSLAFLHTRRDFTVPWVRWVPLLGHSRSRWLNQQSVSITHRLYSASVAVYWGCSSWWQVTPGGSRSCSVDAARLNSQLKSKSVTVTHWLYHRVDALLFCEDSAAGVESTTVTSGLRPRWTSVEDTGLILVDTQ